MTVRVNKPSFNIREKLSELGRKFGLKGSELAAAETVQEARDLVSAGRKNLVINGNMMISQRYGFNNPDSEWDANKKEFLIVGDSFAMGDCVNRPDDIGSVLRHLSNKSVLNLGYSGHNPLLEYATLREYCSTKELVLFPL